MSQPLPAWKVSIQLGDGSVVESECSASTVFGAVKFVQDESVKNGWFVTCILVEAFTEHDIADAVEVRQGALQ